MRSGNTGENHVSIFKETGAVKELDRIIAELNMNMQNNYKDAAQEALCELEQELSEMTAANTLSEYQKATYTL